MFRKDKQKIIRAYFASKIVLTLGGSIVCLELLETEMGYEKQVKKIRRFMGDVLNYFEIAEVILEELQAKKPELSKEVLEAVCLAWQWGIVVNLSEF